MAYVDEVAVEGDFVIAHDIYGRIHVFRPDQGGGIIPPISAEDYIWEWAYHEDNWANTTTFQDLYDTDTATQFVMTAADDLLVDTISMSQSSNYPSMVALRVDGVTFSVLPLKDESAIHFDEPMLVPSGSALTVQVKPGHKNSRVAVTMRGYYE